MKQIMKRFYSIMLVVAIIVTMIPVTNVKIAKAAGAILWPVPGHTSLSRGYFSAHKAIDISDGGIYGAEVVACVDGVVLSKKTCAHNTYYSSPTCPSCCYGSGNSIQLLGDDGRQYEFSHMVAGSIPTNVNVGSRVKMGQKIGQVGSTGNSSGPHLHFVIYSRPHPGYWSGYDPVSPDARSQAYIYNINIAPDTPTGLSINRTEAGIGDALKVSWNAMSGADRYNVRLECTTNGAYSKSITVGGTSTLFQLEKAGTYKVSVSASNSAGTSGNATSANCIVYNDVKVKYVDWDDEQIGNEQVIRWGTNANPPVVPLREGYTFQSWSSDGKNVKSDIEIKAQYKINTYSVSFVDYNGDVIDRTQKIEYLSAATPPQNIPCKAGYVFTGWDSNEYECVKKSLTIRATYVWENTDLPIVTEIKSAKRNEEGTGYVVDINLSNFPNDFTKGKLVVAMMTKDGKMVASETRSIHLPETGETNEKVTVLYSGLAPRVQVSMVGVIDDDTTGTPKSTIVTSAVDIGNEWSDWSATVPDGNDIIKESRTEYRYKINKTIKAVSQPATPSGYKLVSTEKTGTYSDWSNWGGWTDSYIASGTFVDVRTQSVPASYRTEWNYSRWAQYSSNTGKTGPIKGTWGGAYCQYYFERGWGGQLGVSSSQYSNQVGGYFNLYGNDQWYNEATRSVVNSYKTQYSSRTRSEYINYNYIQDDFSEWQTEEVEASSTKQVETRTTYRFKSNSTDVPCYNYKRYKYTNINNGKTVYTYTSKYADSMEYPGEWEFNKTYTQLSKVATVDDNIELYNGTGEDSWYKADINDESSGTVFETTDSLEDTTGVKRTIEGTLLNAAGKVATLLVYKGQNSDPIASQIEYIGQVNIDDDGNYKFDFITKEEPTAKTGDFVVTLGIEGATSYQVIGMIEAPKQVFTVDFVDDLGNAIGEQRKVADGGNVDAPMAPEKEGYYFVGWDTGLKNIRENIVITAQYMKKKCTVVFVDWDNTALSIKEFDYGSDIVLNEIPEVEGKLFEKWVNSQGAVVDKVTDNMIVEASYKDAIYTVVFKDWFGNIISEQKLTYGEQAIIPDDLDAPNEKQIFDKWEECDKVLYVTNDITVTPTAKYIKDTDKPMFTVGSGTYSDDQTVGIYSLKSNVDIYYAVVDADAGNAHTLSLDGEFREYEDEFVVEEDSVVFAYAVGKDANPSEFSKLEINISDSSLSTATPEVVSTAKPTVNPTASPSPTIKPVETPSIDETKPVVSISNPGNVRPGNSFAVDVDLRNNKGFSNLAIEIGYDSDALELTDVSIKDIGGMCTQSQYITKNPYVIFWDSASNITVNGKIATLTFMVKDDAEEGLSSISIDYYKGKNSNYIDGDSVNYNANGDPIGLQYVSGSANIKYYTPGDVNGDDVVNNKDATRLLQYLAGWDVVVVEAALDVNGDNSVNNKDATRLLQYLAGWDVEIH